jgi:hypothetical protein
MAEVKVDKLIETYRKIDAALKVEEKKFKERKADLKANLEKIKDVIQAKMTKDGVKNYKTSFGTAFEQTSDFLIVDDWKIALDFIKEKGHWHVLTKKLSKNEVKEIIKAEKLIFPGIRIEEKIEVKIRKS